MLEDSLRLWLTERAEHTSDIGTPTRVVPYKREREQGLRDLARWVEEGVLPPASTRSRARVVVH